VLDIERRELRRGAEPVPLEPQVFDLLVYLVRNRARVVSKDDLIDSVWGARIVSDSALTTRLNAARKAVGDSGMAQRVIRTVQRKGVRFIGEVGEEAEPAAPVELAPAATEPLIAPGLSIVVLPFANLSNDPEQEYFADGITGDMTTDLSRIPDMLVISRNTAFTYRNRPVNTKQIGRELGVRYVPEGEVQRSGNRVRVTAQLIDAETDAHLPAEQFAGGSMAVGRWRGRPCPRRSQSRVQKPQGPLVVVEVRRVQDLNAGVVLAIERRHPAGAAVMLRVVGRVEPKAQMVGLYRRSRRVLCCIREWRIVEDERCLRDTGGNDECLDAEAPPKVLECIAIIVGFDVPLIPRQPKRCVGYLNHEEVEIGIGWQTARVNKHVFCGARRHDVDLGFGIGKTITGSCRHDHLERDLVVTGCGRRAHCGTYKC
jgi:TolB-like protein